MIHTYNNIENETKENIKSVLETLRDANNFDEVFADSKLYKHIDTSEDKQKRFEDLADKLKTGNIKLHILEKVKKVFQGQEKAQLNKATKIVKNELENSEDYKLLRSERMKRRFTDIIKTNKNQQDRTK